MTYDEQLNKALDKIIARGMVSLPPQGEIKVHIVDGVQHPCKIGQYATEDTAYTVCELCEAERDTYLDQMTQHQPHCRYGVPDGPDNFITECECETNGSLL